MNQEVTPEVLAEVSAPEQVATAAPESVDTQAPEIAEAEQKAKTFTQEELDAAIGKRLAREQRKWEREQEQRQAEAQAVRQPANLSVDQFETPEAYAEALAEHKAIELINRREQQKHLSDVDRNYFDKAEDAREKYDDYDQVAHGNHWLPTEAMVESIKTSDIGPDLAYFLGSNPKEADRIARLSPLMQAKEIGRIEAKLANEPPPAKKTSKAPAPISPVTPKSSGGNYTDLDDPRAFEQMGASAWLEARKAKAIADARRR